MATRLKTVEYAMPVLATMVDNTATAMPQITIYLPEAPSGAAFKSVIAVMSAMQTATAVGNISRRSMNFSVGGATAGVHNNTNLYTGSSEDIYVFHSADMTSHFVANWTSGTSKTFDSTVLIDGTAAGAAYTNVNVTIYITYEYDDTVTTQIKTVRIPLNMPVGYLATSKPAALATIPNLSTELPEDAKVFRNTFITVEGVRQSTTVTDSTLTFQLDSTTAHTSDIFEGVAATNYFMRYIWDCSGVLNTSAAMSWYAYSSLASCWAHMQAFITVTYEFNAAASNNQFISLMMPMEITSPMGGTAAADFQRGEREFWIQEPGTITTKNIAFFAYWDQAAPLAGMQQRIGKGSFVSYATDNMTAAAGSNASMIRNDSAFTFATGRNVLNWDVYRTDAVDLGFNVSGYWIINYVAGKPPEGYGASNHTVMWNLGATFDGAANSLRTITAVAPALPAGNRFYSAVGTRYMYVTNTAGNAAGVVILVERLSDEGGLIWEPAYVDVGYTDPETGLHKTFSQIRTLFKRWTNDTSGDRMSLQEPRRWRTVLNNNAASFDYLDLIFTYHNIEKAVAGTITNSAGGTVTITLHRLSNGEILDTTTRVGNGTYSFPWFDGTEEVYVEAYENQTHLGRSANGVAI